MERKNSSKKMIDHHIHIGQFCENYYNPIEILSILSEEGVDKCYYSSTSNCKKDVKFQEIEKEINNCVKQFSVEKMHPLLWFMPDFISQKLTVERVFNNTPYRGIKLHPRFNKWDLEDKKHQDCLHSLFGFAQDNKLPVLIHTGEDDFEKPYFFEQFFGPYKNANIILAHCRPLEASMTMFRKYPNLKGDTAFVSKENIQTLIDNGFKEHLLTGSDFPITHYFNKNNSEKSKSLKEQYRKDIKNFQMLR